MRSGAYISEATGLLKPYSGCTSLEALKHQLARSVEQPGFCLLVDKNKFQGRGEGTFSDFSILPPLLFSRLTLWWEAAHQHFSHPHRPQKCSVSPTCWALAMFTWKSPQPQYHHCGGSTETSGAETTQAPSPHPRYVLHWVPVVGGSSMAHGWTDGRAPRTDRGPFIMPHEPSSDSHGKRLLEALEVCPGPKVENSTGSKCPERCPALWTERSCGVPKMWAQDRDCVYV